MKVKWFVGALVFFMFVNVCKAQLTLIPADTSYDFSHINLILTNQNPYPAEPGKNVNIEVEIQNNGYKNVNDLVVEIYPKEPFTLLPGENKTKTIKRISGKDSVKTSYNLRVSDSAVSGEYEIEFRFYSDSEYISRKININVQGEPKLILKNLTVFPEKIEPGTEVRILALIKNIGTGTAKMTELKFSSDSGVFIPLLSGGYAYIGDITPGEEKTGILEITVDSDAEYKNYKAEITATYKDENSETKEQVFTAGIPVKGVVKLNIVSQEINKERGVIRIEVANKGTADAKSLEAKLVLNRMLVGVDYTSQLKSTKKTVFDFPFATGTGYLVINYTEPDLKESGIVKEISVSSVSSDYSYMNVVWVVIVLVVIFVAWKFSKRVKR